MTNTDNKAAKSEAEAPIVRIGPAVHVSKHLVPIYQHKPEWIDERRDVRVMAIAEGYAMVRRKGCAPYVCRVKELLPPNPEISGQRAAKGSHE